MSGLLRQSLGFILQPSVRKFSITPQFLAVEKALLSKLRKQTGLPLINCKKALEKFDNDFDEAKKWIEEEALKAGWAKATKLQTRPMSQGLVAVIGDSSQLTMLEVNCETDFVAKNEQFVTMVSQLAEECKNHFEKQTENMISANKEELGQISSANEGTLSDIVALNVGSLGENMALRRGVFLRAADGSVVSSYVHPSNFKNTPGSNTILGKYGALVELVQKPVENKSVLSVDDLGSHLGQHIVGMNPKTVGEYSPSEDDSSSSSDSESSTSSSDEEEATNENKSEEENTAWDEKEESELLKQTFLLDNTYSVGKLLHENDTAVKRFIRYHCGEELEGES